MAEAASGLRSARGLCRQTSMLRRQAGLRAGRLLPIRHPACLICRPARPLAGKLWRAANGPGLCTALRQRKRGFAAFTHDAHHDLTHAAPQQPSPVGIAFAPLGKPWSGGRTGRLRDRAVATATEPVGWYGASGPTRPIEHGACRRATGCSGTDGAATAASVATHRAGPAAAYRCARWAFGRSLCRSLFDGDPGVLLPRARPRRSAARP